MSPLTVSDKLAIERIIKERLVFGKEPDWTSISDSVFVTTGKRPNRVHVYQRSPDIQTAVMRLRIQIDSEVKRLH